MSGPRGSPSDDETALCLHLFTSMTISPHPQESNAQHMGLTTQDDKDELMETDPPSQNTVYAGLQAASFNVEDPNLAIGASVQSGLGPIALELDTEFVRGLHVLPFSPKISRSREINLFGAAVDSAEISVSGKGRPTIVAAGVHSQPKLQDLPWWTISSHLMSMQG
ncbi:hypothetical protein NMY22_g16861 [Coprinellus aureogranulatus]|nr:hypothetical protein NMY22_g16861 [Coprinellus aureogranulatus]